MPKHDATLGNHPLPAVMGRSNAGTAGKANTPVAVSVGIWTVGRDGAENRQGPAKNTPGDTPAAFYMMAAGGLSAFHYPHGTDCMGVA